MARRYERGRPSARQLTGATDSTAATVEQGDHGEMGYDQRSAYRTVRRHGEANTHRQHNAHEHAAADDQGWEDARRRTAVLTVSTSEKRAARACTDHPSRSPAVITPGSKFRAAVKRRLPLPSRLQESSSPVLGLSFSGRVSPCPSDV
ncbi:hypothetical protein L227DRAFT_71471 [Lentinus tigrinus ALCF2SS1-6]|uniref:Uncharacterized protein n=1 Tax=Lentinus tigrinus ALCF2SS1-6 TaxID=1328759 RepID=A0A5C2RP09_9APHY|nr:hypothetical protein L227DRAFT_71471 [Lentinus tigrinus ALCF2SS1-6]